MFSLHDSPWVSSSQEAMAAMLTGDCTLPLCVKSAFTTVICSTDRQTDDSKCVLLYTLLACMCASVSMGLHILLNHILQYDIISCWLVPHLVY